MNKKQFFVIFFLFAITLLIFFIRSRESSEITIQKNNTIFIEVSKPGMNSFVIPLPSGSTVGNVLRSANMDLNFAKGDYILRTTLHNGDSIEFSDYGKISIKQMDGFKLFTLGIPLPLNQSTAEELARIPGIGPELAKRIVEKRNELNRFKEHQELLYVKGIGKGKLAVMKKYTVIN